MNNKITVKLIALFLMIITAGEAFSQFIISAELRPRAEYSDGYKSLVTMNDAPAFSISQRTRLNLAFKTNRFKTYLSLQDVRTWGSQKQLVGNEANAFSVHEAWGEALFGKSKVFGMKLGRQEIILDDHRVFGSVGWAQQARSHDALIFKYTNPAKVNFQVGIAYNQNMGALTNTSYTVAGSYKNLQYLWLNKKLIDNKLSISLLALNKGDEVRNDIDGNGKITKGEYWDNYTQTFGTHTSFKSKKFGASLNAYYQIGKTAQNTARNLNAYLIGLDLSYKPVTGLALFLGYELQSGNNQTDTTMTYAETQHAFTPFFGTNHKFNGFMDYFYVGNHGGSVGLQDIYFKLKYKNSKFNIGGDFHAFLSAAEIKDIDPTITDPTQSMGSYLGTEIDLYAGFPITKGVKFNMGYSMMFGSESMEALKGGDSKQFTNWGYMQVVFKPTFFDSSKFQLKKLAKTAN